MEVVLKIIKLIHNCVANDITCVNIIKEKLESFVNFLRTGKMMLKNCFLENYPSKLITQTLSLLAYASKI